MVPTFIQALPKLIINLNFYKLQEVFVEELVILFLVFVEELMILFPIILCMDGDKVNRIHWMRMQAWKVRMLSTLQIAQLLNRLHGFLEIKATGEIILTFYVLILCTWHPLCAHAFLYSCFLSMASSLTYI